MSADMIEDSMSADIIEDRVLATKLQKKIHELRRLNQAVGNKRIRQKIDEYLCRSYLLARDGHEKNLNGGKE